MSSPRYPIPAQRSRFITSVAEVTSPEQAQSFISDIKHEFPDANHNCWAFLVGPPGSSDHTGLSDDGEPHGVAGRPMLTTLQHSGLGDTAVVVTRYFGGIKLGKGGMVKAYTAAVQTALEQLPRSVRIDWILLTTEIDYSQVKPLELHAPEFECEVLGIDYTDIVTLRMRLPREQLASFRRIFEDLTAGRGELKEPA